MSFPSFRGHNTSIAMTSASSSFGAWFAFGPAAFALGEVAPKPALKLLDEGRIGSGTGSRHMTLQALVFLGDTFPQGNTSAKCNATPGVGLSRTQDC